jgi:hypothetical protein
MKRVFHRATLLYLYGTAQRDAGIDFITGIFSRGTRQGAGFAPF